MYAKGFEAIRWVIPAALVPAAHKAPLLPVGDHLGDPKRGRLPLGLAMCGGRRCSLGLGMVLL